MCGAGLWVNGARGVDLVEGIRHSSEPEDSGTYMTGASSSSRSFKATRVLKETAGELANEISDANVGKAVENIPSMLLLQLLGRSNTREVYHLLRSGFLLG